MRVPTERLGAVPVQTERFRNPHEDYAASSDKISVSELSAPQQSTLPVLNMFRTVLNPKPQILKPEINPEPLKGPFCFSGHEALGFAAPCD